jgi:hypothetical protein
MAAMATPISVTLRRDAAPVYPDQCVVCLRSKPDTKIAIVAVASGILGILIPLIALFQLFSMQRFHVPICRSCKPRFLFQRWGRTVVMVVLVTAAVLLVYPRLREYSSFTRRVVAGGVALVAFVPFVIFETFWPRFLSVTIKDAGIAHDFSSEAYAREFMELNEAAVVESDFHE